MEVLKFKVFNFLNKSKKTTVRLGLLCPTFPYFVKVQLNYIRAITLDSIIGQPLNRYQNSLH